MVFAWICSAGVAWAQTPAAAAANPMREVEVTALDGGVFVVEDAPSTDAGSTGVVTPPVLTVAAPAAYPAELAAAPIPGTVHLELLVESSGIVADIVVLDATHPAMEFEALKSARQLRFKPGLLDGAPASMRVRYAYEFQVEDARAVPALRARLRGQIRELGTQIPLVNAQLIHDGGVVAEAAEDGRFSVELPPGRHPLTVTAPGHFRLQVVEVLEAGTEPEVIYRLKPHTPDPYVTLVRDLRARDEVTRHSLLEQELRETPGTLGDPFRVVMMMPGVSSIASGLSYPIVRGAQPASTGFFVDGIQLPILYHLGLGHAVIHPDAIDRIDFYPGTPPAHVGRFLGGVVDASLEEPQWDRLRATFSLDVVNFSAYVSQPYEDSGTHVTVSGRYSWLAEFVQRWSAGSADSKPILNAWDYLARVEQRLPQGARLRVLALGSSDVIGSETVRPIAGNGQFIRMMFHRLDVSYRRWLLGGAASVGLTYGFDSFGSDTTVRFKRDSDFKLNGNQLRAHADWSATLLPTVDLDLTAELTGQDGRNGFDYTLAREDVTGMEYSYLGPVTTSLLGSASVQSTWQPAEAWSLAAGLRGDLWRLNPDVTRASLDPRLTLRFAPSSEWMFKVGGGLVHQAPTVTLNVPVLDVALLRYGLQEAATVDVGAQWRPLHGMEVSVDGYYTHLTRSLELDFDAVMPTLGAQGHIGSRPASWGRAYGLEVMLRHPIGKNWFGWVAYSLQRATRYRSYIELDAAEAPVETVWRELPSNFDQTHVLHAVLSWKLPYDVTLGGGVHFNSGRPESGQLSSRTHLPITDPVTGDPSWRMVSLDDVDRLPPYWRVDFRISRRHLAPDFQLEIYLDVMNVSFTAETLGFGYDTRHGKRVKERIALPIFFPMLGLKGIY